MVEASITICSIITRTCSLPMREIFKLAKEYAQLPPTEIEKLLDGATHEERVGAVSVMGHRAQHKQTTPDHLHELY